VFESENPYLGAAWALIPKATPADVDRAVAAAFDAFRAPGWRRMSASARGALLQRLADLVAREADRLAEIETRDNGKLITDNDPDWARLQARALAARERPEQWLGMRQVYGDLAGQSRFADAFARWLRLIHADGTAAALAAYRG